MTVTVTRTIVADGTTRTDTLTSNYEPWRAVYLVGPGTESPPLPRLLCWPPPRRRLRRRKVVLPT